LNRHKTFPLIASAAYTAAQTAKIYTEAMDGIHVIIEVTVDPAAASITPILQGLNEETGNYYDMLVGAAITAVGTTVLKVHPTIQAQANASAQDGLPRVMRFSMAVADTDSITYSVDYNGIA